MVYLTAYLAACLIVYPIACLIVPCIVYLMVYLIVGETEGWISPEAALVP